MSNLHISKSERTEAKPESSVQQGDGISLGEQPGHTASTAAMQQPPQQQQPQLDMILMIMKKSLESSKQQKEDQAKKG